MIMKCVNCGNQVFLDIKNEDKDITTKACIKCGHIEYFYRLDKLKLLADINVLENQYEALEIIASNDNQTVKAQKEAEEKMEAIDEKIDAIKKKIAELE